MTSKKPIKPFFSWQHALLRSNLPSTTKLVLLTLRAHVNEFSQAVWPGVELLSKETGLARSSVIEHLGKARELGWIIVNRRTTKDGRRTSNEYLLSFPNSEGNVQQPDLVNVQQPDLVNVQQPDGHGPGAGLTTVRELDGITTSIKPPLKPTTAGLDIEAWTKWKKWCERDGKALSEEQTAAAQTSLAAFGDDQADVVEHSIASGYRGLYPRANRRKSFDEIHSKQSRIIAQAEEQQKAAAITCKCGKPFVARFAEEPVCSECYRERVEAMHRHG
jgi:hypothetical protein